MGDLSTYWRQPRSRLGETLLALLVHAAGEGLAAK